MRKYREQALARHQDEAPFTVEMFNDSYRESYRYTLKTRDDFIGLIEKLLLTLVDNRIFSDFEMSNGKGYGDRLKPLRRQY